MRIILMSSHVRGYFPGGRLLVAIRREDARLGATIWDDLTFTVPPDFHTHNDAVAAALMTLAGTHYDEVTFNFPISTACAETLERFYKGVRVGPVDPARAPRPPGSRLALNFSGGLDSTSVRTILEHALGDDFAVITSEYGRRYAYEEHGYLPYPRDVSCRTDLRRKRFDRAGRFNFCVPLLFAEYLDLGSITTGHALFTTNHDLDALIDGSEPRFLRSDLVPNAGGLDEIHLVRGLHTLGLFTMLLMLAPERAEHALAASARAGTCKHYMRAWTLRTAHEDLGMPTPAYLRDLPPPKPLFRLGESIGADIALLSFVKREGLDVVSALCPQLGRHDLSFLDDFAMDFVRRYHPSYMELVPQPLRDRTLAVFARCGITQCSQTDLDELAVIRRVFADIGVYPFVQADA